MIIAVAEPRRQVIVRGHYTRNPRLARYFQTFMWVSRTDLRVLESPDDPQSLRTDARDLAEAWPGAVLHIVRKGESAGLAEKRHLTRVLGVPGSDRRTQKAVRAMLTGYLLQYYVTVIQFPINIGGRPLHSWPSYIVITFELTILFAAISAVMGMLALCGLPMPYHPVFNWPRFATASRNRFFLCIEACDPLYDSVRTAGFLRSLEAKEVSEVEA